MIRHATGIAILLSILVVGSHAPAQPFSAPLLGAGHYDRQDAADPCISDPNFIAGQYNDLAHLNSGGEAWGCDSEWGACAEFDFTDVGVDNTVLSATLVLRYTGYGDDAQGLPYLGVYGYGYTGEAVTLPRADLNDQTALAIFAPTATTNVDIEIDVTTHVIDLFEDETFQAAFFVCGLFSEVGYSDLVYFGGSAHAYPPRLLIETVNPVAIETESWSGIKALYR